MALRLDYKKRILNNAQLNSEKGGVATKSGRGNTKIFWDAASD